jgi:hypothetical protein
MASLPNLGSNNLSGTSPVSTNWIKRNGLMFILFYGKFVTKLQITSSSSVGRSDL